MMTIYGCFSDLKAPGICESGLLVILKKPIGEPRKPFCSRRGVKSVFGESRKPFCSRRGVNSVFGEPRRPFYSRRGVKSVFGEPRKPFCSRRGFDSAIDAYLRDTCLTAQDNYAAVMDYFKI